MPIHLPAASRAVWLQWSCDELTTGCHVICQRPSLTSLGTGHHRECSNQSHLYFRVRKVVVTQALQWLITHNKYYSANHVCIDENALSQLPEDGNFCDLSSITLEGAAEDD